MKYTEKEIDFIKKEYEKGTNPQKIANHLNRTKRAIISKASLLGVSKPHNYTEYEKQYIRENYKSFNLREIANHLNRPKENIVRWARENGIERTGKKKEFVKEKVYADPKETFKKKSKSMKEWHANHTHPFLGKKHNEKVKKEQSKRAKNYFENQTEEEKNKRRKNQRYSRIKNGTLYVHGNGETGYSRGRNGYRKDLGKYFFKSAWEANYARYLNYLNIKWEYEPKRFIFHNVEYMPISYAPDFYLPEYDQWVEIKGWKDEKSKKRLNRFKEHYPEEYKKLILIQEKEYAEIDEKYKDIIKNWEER